MNDDLLLTKEEIDGLLRVVENVQTTVKSAQSWLDLQNKLRLIRQQFDIEAKPETSDAGGGQKNS